jgi:tRNA A-37 threonylcarbamoyl transferase component Bud32
MERTVQEKLIWPRSKKLIAKTLLSRSQIIKGQRQTLRVFSIGSPDLDRVLASLPALFAQKKCKIVKSERKIVIVRLPLKIDGRIKSVYVKQHNALSFARRLASVIYPSAAMRSLSGAAALLQRGYMTAPPIAAVDQRFLGVLIKSFYISEEIHGAKTVETFWRGELGALRGAARYVKRRLFLRALARLFKSLHEDGIYHNDLKSSNILVVNRRAVSEAMFGLIDLQGLRECFFVSRRRKIKNLAQLNRTLGLHLTRSERLFFLNAYGDYRLLDRGARRELVSRILEQTHRQILREKLRHQAEENYPLLEVAS